MTGQTAPPTDDRTAEVDRLRAENAHLRALLTAALNTAAPVGTATEWGVRVHGHPVRDAVSEVRALHDLHQMRTAHNDAHLVNRTTAYGPWQTADTQETAQ